MTLLNQAAVSEALKSFFLPGLRYQLNDKVSAFLSQIDKNSENVVGKDIVMALRHGRVGGVGNRNDDGDLPTPNSRKTTQAKWETKNIFARFQLTDKTMIASKSSVGAFTSMLEQEVKDCENDAKLDLSRQAMSGGVGVLGTITAVATGLVVPVNDTMFFAEGMLVDVLDATDGITYLNTGVEVTAVDDIAKTITLSAVGVVANGDTIYVSGNKDKELTGLDAVFAQTGSLYNVDRTANPWFKAQSQAIGAEISEVAIQKAIDDADRMTGSAINYMIASHGVRRAYQNLMTASKIVVATMDLKGGYKALDYNGIPMTADKYAKAGTLRLLDTTAWNFYQMSDWNWLNADGAMLSRVANKAAWEATLVKYGDIGCDKPKGQVELTGIIEH